MNNFLLIYHSMNESEDSKVRKVCASLIYYLIGESKELAKYIFDKIQKSAKSQQDVMQQPVYCHTED